MHAMTLCISRNVGCGLCANGSTATVFGSCVGCPAGSYGSAGICHPCAAGTYTASNGATACVACPAGRYSTTNATNGTRCAPCPRGTYANASGASTCLACAAPITLTGAPSEGYANQIGQEACTPRRTSCDPGYYINRTFDRTEDHACVRCAVSCGDAFCFVLPNSTLTPEATALSPGIISLPKNWCMFCLCML